MKKVKDWLNELPEPRRSQALKNMDKVNGEIETDSVKEALFIAFSWALSPEGFEYWDSIKTIFKVQVWFRYISNGQSEKDSEIVSVEANGELQAKYKAWEFMEEKGVKPFKTEIV